MRSSNTTPKWVTRALALVSTAALIGGLSGCMGGSDEPGAASSVVAPNGNTVNPSQIDQSDPTSGDQSVELECENSKSDSKQAFFGDLHIHTRMSFDAYFFNSLNGPREAYRFAQGEDQFLPGGENPNEPVKKINIGRPLDFAAVTEHAEQLGTFYRACTLQGNLKSSMNPACNQLGEFIRSNIAVFITGETPLYLQLVTSAGRNAPSSSTWQELQKFATDENKPCKFTTFNGYEFSSNKGGQVLHRNVIFKGATVPSDVVSSIPPVPTSDNTNDEWGLFDSLKTNCLDVNGCDVVTIPHSMNQSDGRFARPREASTGLPLARNNATLTQGDAKLRHSLDRMMEIVQHKGASECLTGLNQGLSGEEGSGCGFEEWKTLCIGEPTDPAECKLVCKGKASDPLFCQVTQNKGSKNSIHSVKTCNSITPGSSNPGDCTAPLDYARNVIPEGMALKRKLGVNPYQYGFIGSSDTHNGVGGRTDKSQFVKNPGHGGVLDNDPPEALGRWNCRPQDYPTDPVLGYKPPVDNGSPDDPSTCRDRYFNPVASNFTPGGLAGVWARENTRKEIFSALKRRETFATSGSRMKIRTISSNKPLPANVCDTLTRGESPIETGQVDGVPMGGVLQADQKGPYIAVYAVQDPGGEEPGIPLQKIEIIKTWVDATQQNRSKVITLQENKKAPLPAANCALELKGPEQMCAVFHDKDFDPKLGASYYARALENQSCRWSTRMCTDKGVKCEMLQKSNGIFPAGSGFEGYEGCCMISGEPGNFTGEFGMITQQERAWSSPTWVEGKAQ